MITCTCGGKMWRHGRSMIKFSGEEKTRFRCSECRKLESYYRNQGGNWRLENRATGHPRADSEFVRGGEMKLKINNRWVVLVHVVDKDMNEMDEWAIPGGGVATTEQVVEWAKENGVALST